MEWTVFCILTVKGPASKIKLQVITEVNGNSKVQNNGLWNNWMIICSQLCFSFLRWNSSHEGVSVLATFCEFCFP